MIMTSWSIPQCVSPKLKPHFNKPNIVAAGGRLSSEKPSEGREQERILRTDTVSWTQYDQRVSNGALDYQWSFLEDIFYFKYTVQVHSLFVTQFHKHKRGKQEVCSLPGPARTSDNLVTRSVGIGILQLDSAFCSYLLLPPLGTLVSPPRHDKKEVE